MLSQQKEDGHWYVGGKSNEPYTLTGSATLWSLIKAGQILNDPAKPANRFEGYADKAATERKILRDCFTKGDAWFRSGDLGRDRHG